MAILQVIVDVLAVIIIHQMVLAQNQVLTHQELAEVRLVPTESRATTVLTITNVLTATIHRAATIIAVGVITIAGTTAGVAAVAGAIVVHLVAVAQVGAVVVHQVVVAAAQVAHLALAHVVHVNS